MTFTHQPDDSVQRIGKYKILGALGRGSMGVVYRAQDPEIGRIVAIKVLRSPKLFDSGTSNSVLERFKIEARAAGNLRHPHIITVFDVSIEGENPYIVMDFLEGQTLAQQLASQGKLDPARVIRYLRQIASGLDHAHGKNIIHRDIKPSNILIDKSDNAFILDFGVASFGSAEGQDHDQQALVGTPSYMSPEQLTRKELDYRSDLYSLAVMAHELFTGMRPFVGENLPALVNNIINGKPAPLSIGAPELPLTLQVELDRALSKNPADRHSSAESMVAAFSQALGGHMESNESGETLHTGGRKRRLSDWKIASKVQNFIHQGEARRPRKATPQELSPWRPESRSFKAESFSITSAPQYDDRPGTLYSSSEEISGYRPRKPSKYKNLTIGLSLFSICLSSVILYSFFTKPGAGAGSAAGGGAVVSDISGSLDMQGTLVSFDKPKLEPIPAGKEIFELSDQQLLSILFNSQSSETDLIQAIKEARKRSMPQLAEATVGLLKKDSYVVRIETLKLLSDLADPRVVPQVVSVLDDHDPLVRRWAAKTLGKIGDRRIVGYLEARLIKDDVQDVKNDLIKAIEKITGVPYAVP